jgi:hypothetical protein
LLEAVDFKYLNMGHRGLNAARISDLRQISLEQYQTAVKGDLAWCKAGCPMDDPRRLELEGKTEKSKE